MWSLLFSKTFPGYSRFSFLRSISMRNQVELRSITRTLCCIIFNLLNYVGEKLSIECNHNPLLAVITCCGTWWQAVRIAPQCRNRDSKDCLHTYITIEINGWHNPISTLFINDSFNSLSVVRDGFIRTINVGFFEDLGIIGSHWKDRLHIL